LTVTVDRQRIINCVFSAIEQVNATRAPEEAVLPAIDTVLVSDQSGLDSLGLINFVVALEDQLSQAFGRQIPLAESALDPSARRHFATVADLADHLEAILSKE